MDVDPTAQESETRRDLAAALLGDERLHAHIASDWELIRNRLAEATELERPWNDDLVAEIARRRLQHARERLEGEDRPGPGPTLKSSEEMVRAAIEWHRELQRLTEDVSEDVS